MTQLADSRRWRTLGLVCAALLGISSPGAADWLVTREGGRVETKGPWKIKGKLVVFHTADGKLSSLRLADVDLDGSRRATEEAVAAQAQAAAEPEKPPARRKSIRVITDKDVKQAAPPGEAASEDAPEVSGIVVETWSQARHPDDGHVVIDGTLLNASSEKAESLKLKAMIFDQTGGLIAISQAALAADVVSPGEKVAFRAEFPGFFSFSTVKFEGDGRALSMQPADKTAPSSPPDGGEGGR